MKVSHLLSKLFLGAFFLPAVVFSTDLTDIENELDIEMSRCHHSSSSHHCHDSSSSSFCSDKKHETVFASYRNNRDITVDAHETVLFNVKNANKGDGIEYHEDGIFLVKKSGFYLINYGVASIGTAGEVGASFGFNLIKISNHHRKIVDSVLANGSSGIILFLKECDRVAIVSQEFRVKLKAGRLPPHTTSLTDTAHISFLRVDR